MNCQWKVKILLFHFTVGENIKVIDGPFNGFNGSIEKVNEEKRKVRSYG